MHGRLAREGAPSRGTGWATVRRGEQGHEAAASGSEEDRQSVGAEGQGQAHPVGGAEPLENCRCPIKIIIARCFVSDRRAEKA